uniref:Uncharacterized protein n=1 Tax=Rhodosorus marinus TaxID=101924 RepID=A0A7S3EHR0_9RHOD|mmetsp:Transcript_37187/g.148437  ORF Transcript_37187/g.148437 Transcript_37187/m.148437 type:complete len:120 (+) Transcript_37187:1391-1750(+)
MSNIFLLRVFGVSVGWTLHGADGMDLSCDPRIAWTVSFFCEESTRLLPERYWIDIPTEDRMSYQKWIKVILHASTGLKLMILSMVRYLLPFGQEVKTDSEPLNHPDLEVVFPLSKKKMG